ncbi:MAG: 3-hexulose-6-phosphate synthase [Erysipelotrichia bacterium]|nr:3-hexulose-6-phosphate synthase [Erysipelotrichia bacterium]
MKLQAALDTLTLDQCIQLLKETRGFIDIAEIGTPFIIEQGMVPVRAIKKIIPELTVLADAKIMDAGEYEADKCFDAGADIVTVLAAANNATILGAVKSAKRHGTKVMVDMIEIEDLAKRAREVDYLGVDYVCVHTAFDIQNTGKNPLEDLKIVNAVLRNAKSAVAGGVKLSTIDTIVEEGAEIIVVGGAICTAENPSAAAEELKSRLVEKVAE